MAESYLEEGHSIVEINWRLFDLLVVALLE